MAYSIAWNEASPAGASTAASTIDTELQNLKTSVKERMNDILDSSTLWETDAHNPKLLDLTAIAGTPKVARVFTGAAFNLPTGATTTVDFVQETLDTNAFHSNSVNPSRLTCALAGYYRVGVGLTVISGAGAIGATCSIAKNGSDVALNVIDFPAGPLTQTFSFETIELVAASDFFTVTVGQASGNAWATAQLRESAYFFIEKLDGTT